MIVPNLRNISVAVYGRASFRGKKSGDELDEDDPPSPGTFYGMCKLYAENLATLYSQLDVSGIYRLGTDERSDERRETERAWQSLPIEERARIYDAFDAARTRLNAPIETTATVTSGPDNRNPDLDPPAADDET